MFDSLQISNLHHLHQNSSGMHKLAFMPSNEFMQYLDSISKSSGNSPMSMTDSLEGEQDD